MDNEEVRSPEEIMAMLENGDPFLKEIKELEVLTPEQRKEYVLNTIRWVTQSLGWMLQADGKIQLAQRAKVLQNGMKDKSKELTICALWTIKPQFRPVWMELLGTLVGMGEKTDKGAVDKKGS